MLFPRWYVLLYVIVLFMQKNTEMDVRRINLSTLRTHL